MPAFRVRLRGQPMRFTSRLSLNGAPAAALDALESSLPEDERPTWVYWEMGTVDGQALYIAEHQPTFGPRAPAFVWTGVRWICSEDDLSDDERVLMDRVASRCPGGLGGWS